ncbi:hypothetical protein PIB30_020566 [Stylosanthes scabra]|uniref:Uncharacterized protein n=1 Tax=Stylosanthes scabra TaxID=79078 RepID=A0ABU6Q8Z6_9FABA|nr:hypothetical protein [Stylosanthes scabra]
MDSFGEECLPPSLTILWINKCKKLESWITSKGLQSEGLTHLILEDLNKVKSFPREGCLQSLQLSHFANLETVDCKGLHHLTSLQELSILLCPKLENIREENLPASISILYFYGKPACPRDGFKSKVMTTQCKYVLISSILFLLTSLQFLNLFWLVIKNVILPSKKLKPHCSGSNLLHGLCLVTEALSPATFYGANSGY